MPTSMSCPSCGRPASGKFCAECGASLTGAVCGSCGVPLTPGGRFCHLCGAAHGARARSSVPTSVVAWVIGATAVAVLVVWLVGRNAGSPAAELPSAAAAGPSPGAGGPTDISSLTPRERADRLFNRVMTAASQGDTSQVRFFAPMAVQAYGMIGMLDADARYHLGLLEAESGNLSATVAQADTLERENPGHLFAILLRGEAAERSGDGPALARWHRRFLDAYEAQMQTGRQEYRDHQDALNVFRDAALTSRGAGR